MRSRRLSTFDAFLAALMEAQEYRSLLGWQDEENEYAWVAYERLVMLLEVNRERVLLNRPVVSMKDIKRVEEQARGHIDYTRKFAYGCVELVFAEIAPL